MAFEKDPIYKSKLIMTQKEITVSAFNELVLCSPVCLCVCVYVLSHVRLFVTPWTVSHQVSLSTEFSRQGYWSVLP